MPDLAFAEDAGVASTDRVCPYLRGRYQPAPVLAPSEANHCLIVASIHLPRSQQTRYCLGGHFGQCPRYTRQQKTPLPKYITGVRPAPVAMPPPPPQLRRLPWRTPLGRRLVRLIPVVLLVLLIILGWRWRQTHTTVYITPRPPLPTPLIVPTLTPAQPFAAPTAGALEP